MVSQSLKERVKNELGISDCNIDEIGGGISKQVYKITTQDDSFILYIWRRPFDNKLTENQTRGMQIVYIC